MAAKIVTFAACAGTVVAAKFGPITSLPGLASLPAFNMTAGYVAYTSPLQASTHNTFHWIVESQGNPTTDPIVFWTNGGPGCSGLYGMGFEHGPFVAQADGGLTLNPYSWNRFATMVYIEQPSGVGFSYSSSAADYQNFDDDIAATDNAAFLTAFFSQYPQYQSNDLWLTSESYGGNYIPQATNRILSGTDTRLAAQLKGFIVGNPVFSIDSVNSTFASIAGAVQADILYGHATIPLSFVVAYAEAGCNTLTPPAACNDLTTQMFSLAGSCFETNSCGDNLYNSPYGNGTLGVAVAPTPDVDALWGAWLNRADVQSAINANTPALGPWGDCANIGYNVTWPSNIPDYTAAFKAGLKVLIMSGDVDVATCPFAGTQVAVLALSAIPGGAITTNWTEWQALNQTAGYVEVHGSAFTFATVKAAGHEAPGFQPLATFELVSNFISGTLETLLKDRPSQAQVQAAAQVPTKRTQASVLREAVRKSLQRKA